MERAGMSFRFLHALPLPAPCALRLRGSWCAPIRTGFAPRNPSCAPCTPGYLGILLLRCASARFGGGELARGGLCVARNSRSDQGVVGSSWSRQSSPRKGAGGVASERGGENKDAGKEFGGDAPKVREKRTFDKSRSKFDASKRAERNGRRSYSSSSHATPSDGVQGGGGSKARLAVQNGNNEQRGGPASGDAKGGKQQARSKSNKQYAPEQELRRQLDMCSRHADVKRALELYDNVKAEGKRFFNQYNYNIVLYLCSSAATKSLKPSKSGSERRGVEQENQPRGPLDELGVRTKSRNGAELVMSGTESGALAEEERVLYLERGFDVYETMKSEGVPPNEATFTAIARLAVAKEDGDLAFDMVKQMAEAKLSPRLRSYAPALYTYCKLKNATKAFEVDEHMKGAGVALEESELEALLKLSVDAGLEDKVYSLLHRLRTTVRDVSPSVVEAIQQWFTGSSAASAGKSNWEALPSPENVRAATESCGGGWHGLGWLGKGYWEVKFSGVDEHGVCQECGEHLVTIDLDPLETEMFAQSLSKLACQREARNDEFKKFQAWLDRHGPFDAIVDGANVGLYNSNSPSGGGFNFYQLNSVVTGIQEKLGIQKAPLILLHHRRTKGGPAASSFATKVLRKWIDENSIYTTPTGSNDDWYWLYASVRYRCLLVTNDEMRDHLFSLLGNDFFPKWKERHQVRYTINKAGLTFIMPPPYSTVIQESERGSWHVPKSGDDDDVLAPREWMCITRTGHADPRHTKSELSSSSMPESSGSEIQEQIAPISDDEVQSSKPPKARQPRKSSSTLSTSDVRKLEGDSRPPRKKSRSPKCHTVQPLDAGELEEQPKPPQKGSTAAKKSRPPKSSALQLSDAGQIEKQPTPPKRVRSATKTSRSRRSSGLVQKLEAAEKAIGDPIHFDI